MIDINATFESVTTGTQGDILQVFSHASSLSFVTEVTLLAACGFLHPHKHKALFSKLAFSHSASI